MSISWPEVKKAHADARCVGGAEGASPQTVYELTLDQGALDLWVRVGGPTATREPAFSGHFRIEKDKFIFGDLAAPLTATFAVKGPNLALSHLDSGECGDRAIWTTQPWIRQ